jgi:RNA polymerase sigma-70 factor (ECF subfamily)
MPDGPETDEPLLPCVAAGDRLAMESCLERYEGLVWALARRMLGDGAEAEDGVQDVFIELWKSAGRFDVQAGSEATFVVTVARRRLIDARRRRARRPDWDSLDALKSEPAAETLEPSRLDDAGLRALAALRELPDEQRRLMEWALADGLSHSEIAGRTGTPLGTVKSLIRRGLARVREALEVPA